MPSTAQSPSNPATTADVSSSKTCHGHVLLKAKASNLPVPSTPGPSTSGTGHYGGGRYGGGRYGGGRYGGGRYGGNLPKGGHYGGSILPYN